MPECPRHGRHSGLVCPHCEVVSELRKSQRNQEKAAERQRSIDQERFDQAERDALSRERLAEEAEYYRAQELASQQRELVENAHTLQASALCDRAKQLLKAGLPEEAVYTCRDSLEKDRGHQPSYCVLAAALYDTGRSEEAATIFEKAIRLLGTGEWTDESTYTLTVSALKGRTFPPALVDLLRQKVKKYSNKQAASLLTRIASMGWVDETVALLDVGSLSPSDLLDVAARMRDHDPNAAALVVRRALSHLQSLEQAFFLRSHQHVVGPSMWLKVALAAMEVEFTTGHNDLRVEAFDMVARWPTEALQKFAIGLKAAPEWQSLTELRKRELKALFASTTAKSLSEQERQQSLKAVEALAPPNFILGGLIPALSARQEEKRNRAGIDARTTFRRTVRSWLDDCGLGDALECVEEWQPSQDARRGLKAYSAEVETQRAWREKSAGRFEEAASLFASARDLAREASELALQQNGAFWVGWCQHALKDWESASDSMKHAADLAESLKDPSELGACRYWQAKIALEFSNPARDLARAKGFFGGALEAVRDATVPSWIPAESHAALGRIANVEERMDDANSHFQSAESACERSRDETQRASLFRAVAKWAYPPKTPGDYAHAVSLLQKALELDTRLDDVEGRIQDLFELGFCHKPSLNRHGNWADAISLFREALAMSIESSDAAWQSRCLFQIGCSLEPTENQEGDWKSAISLHEQAADRAKNAGDPALEGEALNAVGWCYQPDHAPFGNWDLAREWGERAVNVLRGTQRPGLLGIALFNVAKSTARGDRNTVTTRTALLFEEAVKLFHREQWTARADDAQSWIRSTPQS